MFTSCLVCDQPYPKNEELEYFPNSTRIAFDPTRGRLWAVCRSCMRWSLAPIEDRWEALEELEKAVQDRGRMLSQTDNVSLLRIGHLDVVRVGHANLTEEAWWRYGKELMNRKSKHRKITVAGSVAAGAFILGGWATGGLGMFGAWILWEHTPDGLTKAARWLRFGGSAWRGSDECQKCGHRFRSLSFRERNRLILTRDTASGEIGVVHRCPVCGEAKDGGLHLGGEEGAHVARRLLAYHHHEGANENRIRSATRLIEVAGSPQDLTRIVIKEGRTLSEIQRTGGIALEIAANEAVERRLLALEVAELEAMWKREEELASIVDGELTEVPILESWRQKAARWI